VAKTEDVPRQKFTPLQPSPPPQPPKETKPPTPEPPKPAQAEAKPKPAYTPGDLTFAKPSPTPRPTDGPANEPKPERPRTIREELARQPQNQLPGPKMQQNGGVGRRAELASFDTKSTEFGAYDAALVAAISQRWFTLLDERDYASDSRGKVVLQFALHYDGRVSDMNMAENTTGEVLGLICQKAVLDPAPFAAWPSDMRRILGDVRHIQFTFYYY
jgi:outer membrane biosynthesis protein TonB